MSARTPQSQAMVDLLFGDAARIWLVPGLLVMTLLFAVPVGYLVVASFTDPVPGTANFRTVFTQPLYFRVLANTGISAVGTTVICLLLGYPLAYAIHKMPAPWGRIVLAAVLFSYAVGTMPRAFSWIVILGDRGLVNQALMASFDLRRPVQMLYSQLGVFVGMTHVMLPFMVLTLLSSMSRVPAHLERAARTLGAGPVRTFLHVFWPLTIPGVLAGVMMTCVYSLGFYVVPAVLGGAQQTTVVMSIRELTQGLGLWGLGAALSLIVVLLSAVGAAFYVRLARLGEIEQ